MIVNYVANAFKEKANEAKQYVKDVEEFDRSMIRMRTLLGYCDEDVDIAINDLDLMKKLIETAKTLVIANEGIRKYEDKYKRNA